MLIKKLIQALNILFDFFFQTTDVEKKFKAVEIINPM